MSFGVVSEGSFEVFIEDIFLTCLNLFLELVTLQEGVSSTFWILKKKLKLNISSDDNIILTYVFLFILAIKEEDCSVF